jgi:hypothetical protein
MGGGGGLEPLEALGGVFAEGADPLADGMLGMQEGDDLGWSPATADGAMPGIFSPVEHEGQPGEMMEGADRALSIHAAAEAPASIDPLLEAAADDLLQQAAEEAAAADDDTNEALGADYGGAFEGTAVGDLPDPTQAAAAAAEEEEEEETPRGGGGGRGGGAADFSAAEDFDASGDGDAPAPETVAPPAPSVPADAGLASAAGSSEITSSG